MLFVIHATSTLRELVRSEAWNQAADGERACCLVHGHDTSGRSHLRLQQRMTIELRGSLGQYAEEVATFVVSGQDGDDVGACAASWGATRIVELDRAPAR